MTRLSTTPTTDLLRAIEQVVFRAQFPTMVHTDALPGPLPLFPMGEALWDAPPQKALINLDGQWYRLNSGFDLQRGDGFEFCVCADGIWLVANYAHALSNETMDDVNVRIGAHSRTAAGIGLRFPATAERLAYVESLPVAAPLVQRCYDLVIGDRVDPAVWDWRNADGPRVPAGKPAVIWCRDSTREVFIGLSTDARWCWLARPNNRRNLSASPSSSRLINGHAVGAFRYPATAERRAAFDSLRPSWSVTDAPGRYVMPDGTSSVVTTSADRALITAITYGRTLDTVKVTSEVTLTARGGVVDSTGHYEVQVWADDTITTHRLEFPGATGYGQWSKDRWGTIAEPALASATRMSRIPDTAMIPVCRAVASPDRIPHATLHQLLTTVNTTVVQRIADHAETGRGWSLSVSILAVSLRFADGSSMTVWDGTSTASGTLAGNGDREVRAVLCLTEVSARAWMNAQIGRVSGGVQ